MREDRHDVINVTGISIIKIVLTLRISNIEDDKVECMYEKEVEPTF